MVVFIHPCRLLFIRRGRAHRLLVVFWVVFGGYLGFFQRAFVVGEGFRKLEIS